MCHHLFGCATASKLGTVFRVPVFLENVKGTFEQHVSVSKLTNHYTLKVYGLRLCYVYLTIMKNAVIIYSEDRAYWSVTDNF